MSTTGAQATALVTGSFLSGAMMSLSLMAIPVLLDTTSHAPQLFHQWVRMYHYGHQVLPSLAVGVFFLYGYTSIKKRNTRKPWGTYIVAGLITMSILPFTWIFMVPTNNKLFRLEEVSKVQPMVMNIDEAKKLVVKWSWLHLTRSLLPLVGAIMTVMKTVEK